MVLILVALVSACVGYLARRWHRPVGFVPALRDQLAVGEWRVSVAGSQPYKSISVTGRFPVAPLGLAELVRACESGGWTPPAIERHLPLVPRVDRHPTMAPS